MIKNNFYFDDPITTTTAGMSYDYNIPKEYRSTATTSVSCYKLANQYGACKNAQIVPPSPTSPLPELFRIAKPHSMPKQNFSVNQYEPQNRSYYNNTLYGSPGMSYNLANKNSNDPYRVISMPNQALGCGGLGDIYEPNHFKYGFNDVTRYNYYS